MHNDFEFFTSGEVRLYKERIKKYPANAAQKFFTKLEIDLINNYKSDTSILRVLYKHRNDVTEMLERTPSNYYEEIINLRRLMRKIKLEEQKMSLTLIKNMPDNIEKYLIEGKPIYRDVIVEIVKLGHPVSLIIKNLSCGARFRRLANLKVQAFVKLPTVDEIKKESKRHRYEQEHIRKQEDE